MLTGPFWETFASIILILQEYILQEAPAFLIRFGKQSARILIYTNLIRGSLAKPAVKISCWRIKAQTWTWLLRPCAEALSNTRVKNVPLHPGHIFLRISQRRLRRS